MDSHATWCKIPIQRTFPHHKHDNPISIQPQFPRNSFRRMKKWVFIDIKYSATDLTLRLLQLRTVENWMHTPRRWKLKYEINKVNLFDYTIWTNKMTGKLLNKAINQNKMLRGQSCMIINNKITIMIMLVGLVIHSMIGYLQLLKNLIHYLLHSSNAINSSLY